MKLRFCLSCISSALILGAIPHAAMALTEILSPAGSSFADEDSDTLDGVPTPDGLSNAIEAEVGSDPANPDTDADGLLDGAEAVPTNPFMKRPAAPETQYAAIFLGADKEPAGINSLGSVLLLEPGTTPDTQVGWLWKNGTLLPIGVGAYGTFRGPMEDDSVYFATPEYQDSWSDSFGNAVTSIQWLIKRRSNGTAFVAGIYSESTDWESTSLPAIPDTPPTSDFVSPKIYGAYANTWTDLKAGILTAVTPSTFLTTGMASTSLSASSSYMNDLGDRTFHLTTNFEAPFLVNGITPVGVPSVLELYGWISDIESWFFGYDFYSWTDGFWYANNPANNPQPNGWTEVLRDIMVNTNLLVVGRKRNNTFHFLSPGQQPLEIPGAIAVRDINNVPTSQSGQALEGPYFTATHQDGKNRLWCYNSGSMQSLVLPSSPQGISSTKVTGRTISNDLIIPMAGGIWRNGRLVSSSELIRGLDAISVQQVSPENNFLLGSGQNPSSNETETAVLVPLERAPDWLNVNSDFNEQKIDNATGYAKADNADEDLKAEWGDKQNKIIIDDLHRGFWGVNPNTFPAEFYHGATVTITKKPETDEDTDGPEKGTVRLYAIKDIGTGSEQSWAIPISTGDKPTISSDSPANLATILYSAGSTIPKGNGVSYWIEGVDPGKITLEFKYMKGSLTLTYVQKFNVVTRQSKQKWHEEIRERIKLQTRVAGDEVDVETHHAGDELIGNVKQVKAIYSYYQQLYLQHENKFMWAGMARTAAASIYAAMADVGYANSSGAGLLVAYFDVDFAGIEVALLYGQKIIFDDLAWQHRAYEASGIGALKYVKEDLNDDFALNPWTQIEAGIDEEDQDAINAGNRELLRREQTEVILPTYNIIRGSVPEGSPRTVFNWFAENPMPGGPPFLYVVQDGDITDTDDRWEWIDNPSVGMLAIWTGTSSSITTPSFNAAKRKSLVEKDLGEAAQPYLNYSPNVP